tara:strand:- start:107 stop:736 length:630 start_codon:yes stop_codon:yes gene_type:complete
MEPSIVDYYNETPHGVNVIDKMNEELADVQRKLEDYETPRVMYDNLLEWETLKTQGYNIIREGLNECIVNQPQTIPCITIISVHIYSCITPYIERALKVILKNPTSCNWVYLKSYEIVNGMRAFIESMGEIHIGGDDTLWESVYQNTTPQDISDMLYKNIIWHLDDGMRPCRQYKCTNCNQIVDDYIHKTGECYECNPEDSDETPVDSK